MIDMNLNSVVTEGMNNSNVLSEKLGFDITLWDKLIRLQDEVNTQVDGDWRAANRNWYLAIFLESAELIDSLNWPWWKAKKNDFHNVRHEMIDLLAFLSSLLIENKLEKLVPAFIAAKERTKQVELTEDEKANYTIEKISTLFISHLLYKNYAGAVMLWFDIWYALGFTLEDMFKSFFAKAVLNKFRQDHGYKIGEYIKTWHGREDNYVVTDLIKDIPLDDNFDDILYHKIEEVYGSVEVISPNKSYKTFIDQDAKWNLFLTSIPAETREHFISLAKDLETYFLA